MNATFDDEIHCVAAEPHATLLHLSVIDRMQEVATKTAVLGRLRGGYRILQLKSLLGTRIELAYLFVRISFEAEVNLWPTPRQLRRRGSVSSNMELENLKLKEQLAALAVSSAAEQTESCENEMELESR
mmetsp:Transcript_46893/g.138406  ORF Transcript_46893/g.138406 Transcript_46893/m.138406 type:complete len:129 (+) Transcript_46893:300-686(+)